MSFTKITSYEIKKSRTEQKIPIVNGVYLHSIYNPFKEAEAIVTAHLEALTKKKEVLILGLGFAYHVNAIIDKLVQLHGDDFKIIIIEPNLQVFDDCIAFDLLNKKNTLVYSDFSPHEFYSDLDLIHFLLRKPAIIAHPPSFNLYKNYFKTILTFEAPQNVGAIMDFVTAIDVKNYLANFKADLTLEEVLFNEIPGKEKFESIDFLTMALGEIIKSGQEKKSNWGDH